ncbi:cytochrome d ubiquinol oxidase subunit II [Moritella viscosa]|uniref:Cytochrome d ubiquinol oxidase, subunit II n=1 Tax=Moritella viscosa TaxID=80854 RepID=A0A1L0C0V3_9GAMM|nr:cytochrome d ubiquinol oxidase subunit II [Moritella viscosa]SGZ12516.1 Cytochrome d ubiquinol oxidase, subunit II [Moritella viscosa]SHO12887.1 Cytochrome d ubiquinol oxidase, subunit II [Moritella viscosa]SHO12896.1 Cytochrome d ubiquinol oxidase, subunit II [Moritella viscosa]SHO16789.1 Cytochrome d ubiquinol oxidase, subunit II [Moritella viscosa]SHO18504.1 Cytochrome d ubiquinol oxidase, subunit II [Moritella viscosa]
MFDYESLKLIWWLIIGILLIGFAVTDGMDMGVSGLLPFVAKDDTERRVVINTIAAHWDGNQVWLITAGASLFAAWPMVYATAFSGFYFAMMLTLFCLFLRPLGFDYRSKIDSPKWRYNWDKALFVGSMVPTLVFGIAFGNLLQGVPFNFDEFMRVTYTGSFFALFNPFALLSGVVSVSMVLMHGGTWLSMRTDEQVAARSAKAAQIFAAVLVVSFSLAGLMIATSIDGFIIQSTIDPFALAQPTTKVVTTTTGAWLNNFNAHPVLWLLPTTGIVMAILAGLLARFKPGGLAFTASALSIAGVIFTMGVSMFPFIMPSSSMPNHSLTLWDAVSSEKTLNIMLIVVSVFLPIILCYTTWCYSKMWRTVTRTEIENNNHSSY